MTAMMSMVKLWSKALLSPLFQCTAYMPSRVLLVCNWLKGLSLTLPWHCIHRVGILQLHLPAARQLLSDPSRFAAACRKPSQWLLALSLACPCPVGTSSNSLINQLLIANTFELVTFCAAKLVPVTLRCIKEDPCRISFDDLAIRDWLNLMRRAEVKFTRTMLVSLVQLQKKELFLGLTKFSGRQILAFDFLLD